MNDLNKIQRELIHATRELTRVVDQHSEAIEELLAQQQEWLKLFTHPCCRTTFLLSNSSTPSNQSQRRAARQYAEPPRRETTSARTKPAKKGKKLPPTPCTCGEMHWYRDCPQQKLTLSDTASSYTDDTNSSISSRSQQTQKEHRHSTTNQGKQKTKARPKPVLVDNLLTNAAKTLPTKKEDLIPLMTTHNKIPPTSQISSEAGTDPDPDSDPTSPHRIKDLTRTSTNHRGNILLSNASWPTLNPATVLQ